MLNITVIVEWSIAPLFPNVCYRQWLYQVNFKNKNMDYRIVIETEANGKKWYYVQRRYLLYFWRYLSEVRDISMYAYKIGWHSLEEAEAHIKSDMNTRYENDQKKIVKREYIKYIK